MRFPAALALALGLAMPAVADVHKALDQHILPGFRAFAAATDTLARTARRDCRADAARAAFQAAFDAWMPVADLRIGPSETGALPIAFWPDARGSGRRTLARLVTGHDPVAADAQAYADVSIAARGLLALEMLLYDPAFSDFVAGSYTCTLVGTIATDLDRQAQALAAAWVDGFADRLRTGGAEGNATYLTPDEAVRAIHTQILSSLDFTADQRLGHPMGTFERPRPARAEAWRSGRSLRNVVLAAQAANGLATALADWDLPRSDAALAQVQEAATRIADPALQDVTEPQARLRAEMLQQAVRDLRAAIAAEIGARLDIAPGFNAHDGD